MMDTANNRPTAVSASIILRLKGVPDDRRTFRTTG